MDETMIGFKGRLNFIQYMPEKPTKWGMKAYVLADSRTGYMYNTQVCIAHLHVHYNVQVHVGECAIHG